MRDRGGVIFTKKFLGAVKALGMRDKVLIGSVAMASVAQSAFATTTFTDASTYDPTTLITELTTYVGLLIAAVIPLLVLRVTLPTAIRWVTGMVKKIHL